MIKVKLSKALGNNIHTMRAYKSENGIKRPRFERLEPNKWYELKDDTLKDSIAKDNLVKITYTKEKEEMLQEEGYKLNEEISNRGYKKQKCTGCGKTNLVFNAFIVEVEQ